MLVEQQRISHYLTLTMRRNEVSNGLIPLRLLICCLLFLFASFSCTDSPSASDNVKVTLTFEDASCVETWLRLKIENATPPYSISLSRDGNTLSTLHILSSDTRLIDEVFLLTKSVANSYIASGKMCDMVWTRPSPFLR